MALKHTDAAAIRPGEPPRMHILIIHHETEYFAGAEKMLGYFLEGMGESGHQITVAAVPNTRVAGLIPAAFQSCWVRNCARFSLFGLAAQARAIRRCCQTNPFDVIHGWSARDWELTALTSTTTGIPALGTLHDHPQAGFISRRRQRLMSWSGRLGLRRIVCVSEAVRRACVSARYPSGRLRVVHNGLPPASVPVMKEKQGKVHLGFLGVLAERKGLQGLFEILDVFAANTQAPWELAIAGEAQEEQGRLLIERLKNQYGRRVWWPQVRWCGWVKRPSEFLAALDVLICPSSEFDPFPTVLLEAGQAAVPVLAARVGGVPEIVQDGQTGWLFDARAWVEAGRTLAEVVATPKLANAAGLRAKKRVEDEFAIAKMASGYLSIYKELSKTL